MPLSSSERPPTPPRVIFLVGETASGKHSVAMSLAREIGAEILSLDSMKVYRGMDVGTAKPSRRAQDEIPHRLLDLVDPPEGFSVARYVQAATLAADEVVARGRVALFSGGTGLYLRALTRGLFRGPGTDENARRELQERYPTNELLHARLGEVDPARASVLHPSDRKRVLRALEVHLLGAARPMTTWIAESPSLAIRHPYALFCVERAREDLSARIARRTVRLFGEGFVQEVARLDSAPTTRPGPQAGLAIGYPEVRRHLAGDASLDETLRAVENATRKLARKQRTWLNSFPEITRVRLLPGDATDEIALRIAQIWAPTTRS